jgi:dienelactone hydrolase
MGPIDLMAAKHGDDTAYFWSRQAQPSWSPPVAAQRQRPRQLIVLGYGVQVTNETIAADGFIGQYWTPPSPSRHAAVLEFGGSEGGLDGQLTGALLASHGYPTLDIAYFGEPGLPAHLQKIPLEYFATALRWLAARPQADPQRIWVSGVSRGSEAALLLGVNYPSLVHGVIASVPSDVVLCGLPACDGPAWTLNGKPVPYSTQTDDPHPTDNPQAIIPVGRIHGPILLDCGGADTVWTSCAYAQAITTELTAVHDPRPHDLFSYPDAGHDVGALVPYEPSTQSNADQLNRTTSLADRVAGAALWPRLLAFLAS